jgi:hypothetical protein
VEKIIMARIRLVLASMLLITAIACGGGSDSGPADCTAANPPQTGPKQSHSIGAAFSGTAGHAAAKGTYTQGVNPVSEGQFVINKLILPQQRSDDAMDLNGDGKVDNQMGNIIGALAAQSSDPQPGEDQAVASGTTTELLRLNFPIGAGAADCVTTTAEWGKPSTPTFDGADHFTIDDTSPAVDFGGKLAGNEFKSNSPVTTKHPVTVGIRLVALGSTPVTLVLNGAHLQYTVQVGAPPRLLKGQINGSVKQSDVTNRVIPAIAASLNQDIQNSVNGTQAQKDHAAQTEKIFDVGDGNGGTCTKPEPSPELQGDRPNDGAISSCEVANNNIIKNVLAPDVQIFDASGNYAPNKDNTNKDSLSIGFGFTAVSANF